MERPQRLWDQYTGKVHAELGRGSGCWPEQPHPVALEPPWDQFDWKLLTPWDYYINGWEAPYEANLLRRAFSQPEFPRGQWLELEEDFSAADSLDELAVVSFAQFPQDDTTIPLTEQFLHSLLAASRPVAFEVVGTGACRDEQGELCEPAINVQFASHSLDAALIEHQLTLHYPNSAVVRKPPSTKLILPGALVGYSTVLALENSYAFPLRHYPQLKPDPIAVAVAAMERLGEGEWAVLQILLQPAHAPWAETLQEAVEAPYQSGEGVLDAAQQRQLRDKLSRPLFAASIRLAASRHDVFRQLIGWAEQFANPPHQRFLPNDNGYGSEDDQIARQEASLHYRCTYRPGIILNINELAGLLHPPTAGTPSERLHRVTARTRPARATSAERGSVVLGENVHRGQTTVARIPAKLRPTHCYIAGATGMGKSTLLLSMLLQDIAAGNGAGLLDPHGDLVKAVLSRIPPQRIDDVVLFDPTDTDYPVALNILEARHADERERLATETVTAIERYFPSSWGPRLERILTYTIHTVLETVPGATLADLERVLTDPAFRREVASKTRNQRLRLYWEHEFPKLPGNALDPVLNKLGVFLINRVVRNIVCQRRSAIDFDQLINSRKIFLCNLSTGLLTEKIAHMLGSFIVSKIIHATFRRAAMPEEKRQHWYLYVDEFQNFVHSSIGFETILAEARKFRLVLTLANQYTSQLSTSLRDAISGNVGTKIAFRLGISDARTMAAEMGEFTDEEIMNLELGQCLVRTGASKTTHNVQTYPPPALPVDNPTSAIIQRSRECFSRPRRIIERELADEAPEAPPSAPKPSRRQRRKAAAKAREREKEKPEPRDPSEDDLVN